MPPDRKLIFDLGLFDGSDTAFYLRKGFRVVAVEAQPDLCLGARKRFAREISDGQLVVIERAIWMTDGDRVPFYIRSGWSSVIRASAERDGGSSEQIEVLTTTMDRLFEEFGVPYYLKADVEAAEHLVIDAIDRQSEKPAFVSVEDPTGGLAPRLHQTGYDQFQMINQAYLKLANLPRHSREGANVKPTFDGRCSGLFGHDLPRRRWVDLAGVTAQMHLWNRLRNQEINPIVAYAYRRIGKITGRGWLIGAGWADIHATTCWELQREK